MSTIGGALGKGCLSALAAAALGGCNGSASSRGVVLGDEGTPVAGAEVRVAGQKTTTASDGSFEFTPASTPYDATVIVLGNRRTTYKGLSRKDPVLYARGAQVAVRHTSQISGRVTGGGFPADPSTAIVAAAIDVPFGFGSADAGNGTFSMTAGWGGGLETAHAALRVLARSPASGTPSTYTGYGEQSVTLANGGSLAGVQIAMSAIGTVHAGGHLSLPADSTVSGLSFDVVVDAVAMDTWVDPFPDSTSSFTVPIPDLPRAAVRVQADASGMTGFTRVWRFLRAGMTDLSVEVPAAPVLLSPPVGATDLSRNSPLSWTAFSGGVYLLDVDGPDAGSPYHRVVTATTTMLVSELDTLARLPTATRMSWRVTAIGPFADVDATATPAGYSSVARLAMMSGISLPGDDRVDAASSSQTFTLAP